MAKGVSPRSRLVSSESLSPVWDKNTIGSYIMTAKIAVGTGLFELDSPRQPKVAAFRSE
jgi:hypothetical protein